MLQSEVSGLAHQREAARGVTLCHHVCGWPPQSTNGEGGADHLLHLLQRAHILKLYKGFQE